ncbi:MmgE/PrpD family protein [Pigmentiphaga kullae]|uniref:2-methylcitrate dehydratase n=1 Tax=Pigmentiphaga kullae TaxID=151784 RepID=A0A4Q7NN73_9BURK|nr:MmgE/PrpD family protein [Pigmentiphaga kullae]RZS86671.1 2-methylcitrate dehydratase [Pigmentiphaga kullae]
MNQEVDAALASLTRAVADISYGSLSHSTVQACISRIVDVLGCAMAAWPEPICGAARALARRALPAEGGARILGTRDHALAELAAFANCMAARYMDGNDTYLGGGGHPSDVVPAVLAVADAERRTGREAIAAVVAAYEAYETIFQLTQTRETGWDHTLYTAVGSAAGAAKLLGLDRQSTAQALSIAMTANHGMIVTRRGELSSWKGSAAPYAARDGVFCAYLARAGFEGPARPFSGAAGMQDHFGVRDWPRGERGEGAGHAVERSHLKPYLCYYHAQTAIELATRLAANVRHDEIEKVVVHVYEAKGLSERDPGKWRPATRASADHSIPYIVSAVLVDGVFTDAAFDRERLVDTRIHAVADKLELRADPAFSLGFPETSPCRIEIVTRDGRTLAEEARYPRGHLLNPLAPDEIHAKFLSLATRTLPERQAREALGLLLGIDQLPSVDTIFDALVVEEPAIRPLSEETP